MKINTNTAIDGGGSDPENGLSLALDGTAFLLKEQVCSLEELLDLGLLLDKLLAALAKGAFHQIWAVSHPSWVKKILQQWCVSSNI